MKPFYLIILFLIQASISFSQNIGIGTNNPNPAAKLEVQSNNSGVLLPRLTSAQKIAIPSPPAGLIVFDNTLNRFSFFDGAKWTDIKGTGTEDSIWATYVSNGELNVYNAIGSHFFLAGAPTQAIGSAGNIEGVLQLEHNSNPPLTTAFFLSMDGNGIQARTKSGGLFSPYVDASLSLNRYGGNVGVGIPNPLKSKLEVYGMVGNTVGLFAGANGTSKGIALIADWPGLYFNSYFNNGPRSMGSTGYAGIVNFDPDNGNIIFGLSNQPNNGSGQIISLPEMMRITKDGRVGIGTANPTYPLSVNGQIQAKEIRVETGWSDYVFDRKYKLPSLNEVEKYIQQYQHLPGIPSAEEISKNGLPVAEVNTKMMAKIEELTLYLIELKKIVEKQEKQIAKLTRSNNRK
jgi:hypothetical protein